MPSLSTCLATTTPSLISSHHSYHSPQHANWLTKHVGSCVLCLEECLTLSKCSIKLCWINEWITGYTFIYTDLNIAYHGLGIVTPNCFVGKNTPEKNIQKARAGGVVPSQVNTQRQFIPTNLSSLNVNWLRKLHPVDSASLCGLYINKATLPLDEFWYYKRISTASHWKTSSHSPDKPCIWVSDRTLQW